MVPRQESPFSRYGKSREIKEIKIINNKIILIINKYFTEL